MAGRDAAGLAQATSAEPRSSGEERWLGHLLAVARILAALFAYLGVLFALTLVLFFVGTTLLPGSRQGPFALLGLGVAEAGAFLSVLWVWRKLDRRPITELGLATRGDQARRQWLRGAAIAVLMMGSIVLVWYTLVDGATWSTNPDLGRASIALVIGFVGFLIQGPSEEVLFRGYILENVRDRWGVAWAVGVSSLTFAALHGSNTSFGVLPFLNLILFGVATALYKLRIDGGQLWGVFAIHSIWNWLQQVVFGLPNSGNASSPDNTLFTIQPNFGLPEPIWGGGFGPEGTLAATVVLLALIVATLRVKPATTRLR